MVVNNQSSDAIIPMHRWSLSMIMMMINDHDKKWAWKKRQIWEGLEGCWTGYHAGDDDDDDYAANAGYHAEKN